MCRLAGLLVLLLLVAPLPAQAQVFDVRPDAASPGQVLRLYGPGLTGSLDAVTIGGQVASIVDDASPDRILVEVPSTPGGPAPVELQRSSGGPLEGSELFTVVTGGPGTLLAGEGLFSDTDNQSSPHTLDVGDIDGDGSLDVLAGFLQNGTVAWFPNDGSGTKNTVTSGFNYPRAVLLADVVDDQDGNAPGDGDLDIIAAAGANIASSDGDDKIRVFPNQGNSSFGGQDIVGSTYVDDVRDIAAGDLDGDGDVDLVSVSQDNGRVVLHLNETNSSSFVHSTLATLNDPRAIELADVDRDGLLDLLVAEHGSGGRVTLIPNAGSGSFDTGQVVLSDLTNAIDLTVADFNTNGAPGVAVAVSGGGSVLILPNEGGSLAATPFVQAGLGPVRTVHAADLNGDARPDLLTANEGTGETVWLANEGSGFTLQDPISASPATRADAHAADLDADGDLDPIYASQGPDQVSVFRNGGSTPSISGFPGDQTIDEDGTTGELTFTVSDAEDTSLAASPSSDNPDLVPNANITVTGPDTDGIARIEVVPRPDSNSAGPTGTATITVSVEDEDANVRTDSFELTVSPVNDAPTIGSIPDQTISEDGATGPISVSIRDVETDAAALSLSVSSDAPDLLPDRRLTIEGSGPSRTLRAVPRPDSSGTATLTVTTSDGQSAASTSFTVDVTPVDDPPRASFTGATAVTATAATLTGTVTPLDAATDASFTVERTDDTGGTRTVAAGTALTGSTPQPVQATVTGLEADTQYRVVLKATSSIGAAASSPATVTTVDPLSTAPDALAFAPLGADSRRSRPFTLTNNDAAEIRITRVALAGADPGAFSLARGPAGPFSLAAGADTTFRIAYAPTSPAGSQSARLEVETALETETVPLQGTAEPRFTLDAGRIPVGQSVEASLGYSNPLPEAVSITGADVTGPAASSVSIPQEVVDRTFASGATAEVPVRVEARTAGPLTATITLTSTAGVFVVDVTATALALQASVSGSQRPVVGSSVPIQVSVPSALSPSRAVLHYRRTGDSSFERQSFEQSFDASGQTATVSLPGSALSRAGAQFFVEVVDETGTEPLRITAPAGAPQRGVQSIAPRLPSVSSRGTVAPRVYRMYSVPVRADTSLAAVLTASYNFGPYDASEWRAFRHPPSLDDPATESRPLRRVRPQEFPQIDRLDAPGTAFWHITQTDRRLRLRNGTAPDPDGPVSVPLKPGWNQIGVPFPFPIAWQTIVDTTRAALPDSAARAALDRVRRPVAWTGRRYRFDVGTLRPWQGYFVFNPNPDRPVTLRVPPVRTASPAPADRSPPSLDAIAAGARAGSKSSPPRSYRVQMRARVSLDAQGRTLRDRDNWVGLLPGAQPGAGPEDLPEPPPVGDYVRLSVIEPDAPGRFRATSFRPLTETGHAWDIEVGARVRERFFTRKDVTVSLDEHGTRPDGFRLYVLDLDDRRLRPLQGGSVQVPLTAERPVRRLRVIAGTESFAARRNDGIPLQAYAYRLEGNAPNPFDRSTRISYTLREASRVRLVVYDLLGRRIRTLVDGEQQTTGPQTVTWNGRNAFGAPVASGVYVYRLEAGSFTATGKMTVVR